MQKTVANALRALLYEVVVNPKPGLVDPADTGSHNDMDVFTFIDSSIALAPYLTKAYEIGQNFAGDDLQIMFNSLRKEGVLAEKAMFKATENVNTHKGAVFSLGIFVCAKSYADKNGQNIYEVIRQMCQGLSQHDLVQKKVQTNSAGEEQFKRYGIKGVREIAEGGYQIIEKKALPFLNQTTGTINQRLMDTLIYLAGQTEDSTFIKRSGGLDRLTWLKQVSKKYLTLGGCKTKAGFQYLFKLNKIFKTENLSLGGCADLLIITIFMALEENTI